MKRIICIEDDKGIRDLLIYALQKEGYDAVGYPQAKGVDFTDGDLIILDIMLPDEDGMSILKRLKSNVDTADIPVIMLTAKTDEIDIVNALNSGAEDYIQKPFGVMELLARVKVIFRRSKDEVTVFKYRDILLDVARHKVTVKDREVRLTNKEFELLRYLMINMGIALSREKILNAVWGYEYLGDTRTIDVHIRSLRLKLGEWGDYIKTVTNVGYKLGD